MFIIISPAKKLNEEDPVNDSNKVAVGSETVEASKPQFGRETRELHDYLLKLSPEGIMKLMGISRQLAELNYMRYRNLFNSPCYCAIFMFQGDTYQGLYAEDFSSRDLVQAQQRLRILSGLYGILRPLDLISPYRLEMGSSLATTQGKNLYDFWGDKLGETLRKEMIATGDKVLVNLASPEYSKSVLGNQALFKKYNISIITPKFYDKPLSQGIESTPAKSGKYSTDGYKVIGFLAKKARGAMARYIIQNNITETSDLASFNWDGYRLDPALSTELQPIFRRNRTQAA